MKEREWGKLQDVGLENVILPVS